MSYLIQYKPVPGGVEVSRQSALDGQWYTMTIHNATEEQIIAWIEGAYVQHVMPHVTDEEREFLISGLTPEAWAAMFDEEEPA